MLMDTHCHLDFFPLVENFSKKLQQWNDDGISQFLIPSISPENWSKAQEMAEEHRGVAWALGLHPWYVQTLDDLAPFHLLFEKNLRSNLNSENSKLVAIGEIGLDLYPLYKESYPLQLELFAWQLGKAREYDLPIIVHVRRAHQDAYRLLKEQAGDQGWRGVLHGFSGSYEQALQYLDLGLKIGIGPAVCNPEHKKLQRVMELIPIEKILLETDAPVKLTPHWKEVGPSGLLLVLERVLAVRREIGRKEMIEILHNNADETFPRMRMKV
jgi:TatD DNase family protein